MLSGREKVRGRPCAYKCPLKQGTNKHLALQTSVSYYNSALKESS